MTRNINKSDLIVFMLNEAMNRGIKCLLEKNDPNIPCKADCDNKTIIINMNWKNQKELPFKIGHVIGHIANGDHGIQI